MGLHSLIEGTNHGHFHGQRDRHCRGVEMRLDDHPPTTTIPSATSTYRPPVGPRPIIQWQSQHPAVKPNLECERLGLVNPSPQPLRTEST